MTTEIKRNKKSIAHRNIEKSDVSLMLFPSTNSVDIDIKNIISSTLRKTHDGENTILSIRTESGTIEIWLNDYVKPVNIWND